MSNLTLLSRYCTIKGSNLYGILYLVRNLANKKIPTSSSSSSSSDSDTDKKQNKSSNDAAKKLNLLLQDMLNEKVANTKPIEVPRPRRHKEAKLQEKVKTDVQSVDKNVVKTVKDVAESLGGNIKQTESELLAKLLSTSSKDGDQPSAPLKLSELVKGMKIDKDDKTPSGTSRARQVRAVLKQNIKSDRPHSIESRRTSVRRATEKMEKIEKIDLFGSKPLGYFKGNEQYEDGTHLRTWEQLNERELQLAVTHPPTNYFQQMILWTEQGKLWKFPIDNEQGMEEEHNIYFTEHVFLEKYLDQWCPSKGPIRHFMELVCVGLSKNPYMSVQHKRDHIAWYKDYFADKQKLLKEIGAVPQDFKMSSNTAQISKD